MKLELSDGANVRKENENNANGMTKVSMRKTWT